VTVPPSPLIVTPVIAFWTFRLVPPESLTIQPAAQSVSFGTTWTSALRLIASLRA
jgi:hypothetical protein